MPKKYTQQELTRAILLIVDEGLSIADVAKETGINYRALYRYRDRYVKGKQPPKQKKKEQEIVVHKDTTVPNAELQRNVDAALIERAKFLNDLMQTKQLLLDRIAKIGEKSNNLDALQRSLKTLNDIETVVKPADDTPLANAKTINMFQFINQQLIDEGYEGPKLTDADIVRGID